MVAAFLYTLSAAGSALATDFNFSFSREWSVVQRLD